MDARSSDPSWSCNDLSLDPRRAVSVRRTANTADGALCLLAPYWLWKVRRARRCRAGLGERLGERQYVRDDGLPILETDLYWIHRELNSLNISTSLTIPEVEVLW